MLRHHYISHLIRKCYRRWYHLCVFLGVSCQFAVPAWAQDEYISGYGYHQVTQRGQFYKLITGGFGSLVMVFMGLGGIATIFVTRQGKSGKQTPILGIVMLFIAIVMFAVRIGIRGGLAGHEYMEW